MGASLQKRSVLLPRLVASRSLESDGDAARIQTLPAISVPCGQQSRSPGSPVDLKGLRQIRCPDRGRHPQPHAVSLPQCPLPLAVPLWLDPPEPPSARQIFPLACGRIVGPDC